CARRALYDGYFDYW
nr:immunoglobulin heavy chain junction region [Mus musculus]MBK4189832.1 immunoglobulin heavy chain junction region [Mus musculus]MBK4189833.1 immunoglobulin heavy chain junction region [Mus musculus]